MKKLLLQLVLSCVAVLVLCFFVSPGLNQFINNQMAAVIGIDLNGVLQWQSQKGLNKNLALGDRGSDVRLLQQALNASSISTLAANPDGSFGPKTSLAVSDFQNTRGLAVTGLLDTETRAALNALYLEELCPIGHGSIFPDELLVHVNKNNSLPLDYIPTGLVDVSASVKTTKIVCVKKEVQPYLKQMFNDAALQGVYLGASSGFRRAEVQSSIYKALIALKGEKAKDRIAEPLHSEHQLGTTLDLTGQSIGYVSASDRFVGTKEDLWLRANAHKYGFVQSYPKDKTEVTGYDYESWHYRFIGTEIAKEIFDKKISVEEYLSSLP